MYYYKPISMRKMQCFFDLKQILVTFLLYNHAGGYSWLALRKIICETFLLKAYDSVDNRVWLLENRLFIAMRPVGVYLFYFIKNLGYIGDAWKGCYLNPPGDYFLVDYTHFFSYHQHFLCHNWDKIYDMIKDKLLVTLTPIILSFLQ